MVRMMLQLTFPIVKLLFTGHACVTFSIPTLESLDAEMGLTPTTQSSTYYKEY
jgi:hypothetical protein